MAGRHATTGAQPLAITAGDPETGVWCPVCLTDTRLRIPLYLDGEQAGGIEICPGCGTGHDRPGAYLSPEPPGPQSTPPLTGRGTITRLAALFPRRAQDAPVCDRQHCGRRSRRVVHDWTDGAGSSLSYRFCSKRCRRAWRAENGL